jgi:hypothetical protein
MSGQDKAKILLMVIFFLAGCGLLYYVFRCLKNGKVGWTDRFRSGEASRNTKPDLYWFNVLYLAGIAITLVVLSILGIHYILTHPML